MSSEVKNRPHLSSPGRVRKTPYTRRVEQAGVKAYTVYNHTQLPTMFQTMEADYRHLKTHVQVWDVSVERQVQVSGPDATKLMNMVTPRDLTNLKPGKCMYAPIVDAAGGMLNDPVVLMPADGCYWISIADSDLLLWVKGLERCGRFLTSLDMPCLRPRHFFKRPDVTQLERQSTSSVAGH